MPMHIPSTTMKCEDTYALPNRQTWPFPPSSSPHSSLSHSLTSAAKHLKSLLLSFTVATKDSVSEECRPSGTVSYRTGEITQCLRRLTRAAHGVACQSEGKEKHAAILVALLAVLERSQQVLLAAKAMLENPDVSLQSHCFIHALYTCICTYECRGFESHPGQFFL